MNQQAEGLECEDVTGGMWFAALNLLLMLTFFLCWQFLVSRSDAMVVVKGARILFGFSKALYLTSFPFNGYSRLSL